MIGMEFMSSKPNKNFAFYFSIFWHFFSISALTLGGGYVMVAVMQNVFVEKKRFLSLEKFTQLLASAQILPGPIALTSSIFIGNEIAGFIGSIIGIIGTTLPPFFAIYLVYLFVSIINSNMVNIFMIGVKAATIAAIFQFLIKIIKIKKYDLLSYFILIIFTIIGIFFNLSVILILFIGAAILVIYSYFYTKYS